MEYLKLNCRSALHPHKHHSGICAWDLNVYRGCSHGCKYCYAIYSHDYLDDRYFYDRIYCKTDIPSVLEKELSDRSWKKEPVNLGGVTDSYQKAEEKMKIMPHVLNCLARHRTPAVLLTKSDLILRDIDHLHTLQNAADVKVSITITTLDRHLSTLLEPGAPSPQRRLDTVCRLREEGISAGVSLMPIIPFLTDGQDDLECMYREAASAGAQYMPVNILFLIGKTKQHFLNFAESVDHRLFLDLDRLYNGRSFSTYVNRQNLIISHLQNKYSLPPWTPMRHPYVQTNLMDFK